MKCEKCIGFGWKPACDAWIEGSEHLCVLHAGAVVFPENIDEAIRNKIENNDYDFSGAIFPFDVNFNILNNKDNNHEIVFKNCLFKGEANFKDIKFNGYVDFSKSKFEGDAIFENSTFIDAVNFNDAVFSKTAVFKSCRFENSARIMNAKFKGKADFNLAKFNAAALFQGALFENVVSFSYCKFGMRVNDNEDKQLTARFSKVICAKGVQFTYSKFYCNVDFEYFNCFVRIDFRSAEFKKRVRFAHARFDSSCDVDLSRAVINNMLCFSVSFRGNVKSVQTQYANVALFVSCGFWKMADFSDAKFFRTAIFYRTSFGATTVFDRVTFSKRLLFNKSRFSEKVFFWQAVFPGSDNGCLISFEYTHISSEFPLKISDCDLSCFVTFNVDLRNIIFNNCSWPKDLKYNIRIKEDEGVLDQKKLKQIENNYRILKQKAMQGKSELTASDWHYKEKSTTIKVLCGELHSKGSLLSRIRFEKIFIISILYLYGVVSGFGEKPLRASLFFLGMVIFPFAAYGVPAVAETGITPNIDHDKVTAVVASALHCIPFVKYSSVSSYQSSFEMLFSVFWQIIIAFQAALFGFSLRNKFRR